MKTIILIFFLALAISFQAQELTPFLVNIEDQTTWGYMDEDGKVVIEDKYQNADFFYSGRAAVMRDGKWGMINANDQLIVSCEYDKIWNNDELIIKVMKAGKTGLLNKFSGKEIIPAKYDDILSIADGMAKVKLDGKVGFVDLDGKEITPVHFENAGDFSEGFAAVLFNGRIGYIDQNGKVAVPYKYDWSSGFHNGRAVVQLNSKYGYIDRSGNEITSLKFDKAEDFKNGTAIVNVGGTYNGTIFSGGKYGFIDTTGKIIVALKYDYVEPFYEKQFNGKRQFLAEAIIADKVSLNENSITTLGKKAGFIDREGKEVIPLKYREIHFMSNGLITVFDHKWGILDGNGKKLTPFKYDYELYPIYIVTENDSTVLMQVEEKGKYGYIDMSGKEIIRPVYSNTYDFTEGVVGLELDGKWGFVDTKGKQVVPFKYENVFPFSEGKAEVELAGEKFHIDKTGKRLD